MQTIKQINPDRLKSILKMLIIILIFLPVSQVKCQEEFTGEWGGSILLGKVQLKIYANFFEENDSLKGKLDIPQQNAKDRPLINVTTHSDSCFFELLSPRGTAYFKGQIKKGLDNRIIPATIL